MNADAYKTMYVDGIALQFKNGIKALYQSQSLEMTDQQVHIHTYTHTTHTYTYTHIHIHIHTHKHNL